MNVIAMIGNVAAKPEFRRTQSGRSVCTFRLAISRPGSEHADFFTVSAWERQAEICDQYLHVGRRVGVEGRLHQSVWQTDEGKRSRIEVVATRVQLLGAPRDSSAGGRSPDATEQRAEVETPATDTAAATVAGEPAMAP